MKHNYSIPLSLIFLLIVSNPLLSSQNNNNYLIITPTVFVEDFQPLKIFKEAMGMDVFIITLEQISTSYNGRDIQEKIRNCIIHFYSNNDVYWVLLIGKPDPDDNPRLDTIVAPTILDKEWEMPVRYVYCLTQDYDFGHYTYVPSDMYYSCLDGNWDSDMDGIYGEKYTDNTSALEEIDWIPNVSIGRIPVTNQQQLITYLKKLLSVNYSNLSEEQLKVLQISADINKYIQETNVHGLSLAESPGYELPTVERVNNELNTGDYKILTITGHSFADAWSLYDGGWTGEDLIPGSSLFFCYASACYSSEADFYIEPLTVAEKLLFKDDCGAIGYIGAWRSSTPVGQNDFWKEYMKAFYADGETRVGVALNKAIRSNYYRFAYSIHYWYDYYHFTALTYNLFGDPQLQLGKIKKNGPIILSIPSPISQNLGPYYYDDDNIAEAKGEGQIKWGKISGPEYFKISEDGHVDWIPDVYGGEPNNNGRPWIMIEASDSSGSSYQEWELQCMEPGRISSTPNNRTYLKQPYKYDENDKPEVMDLDDVRWKLVEGPLGFKIDSIKGIISWLPIDTGEFEVVIQAHSGWRLDFQRYSLKVICTPEQPSVISGNTSACLGVQETYNVINDLGITYGWSATGGTVTGSGNTVMVTWNTWGNNTLTVTPSNSCGSGTSRQLIISVNSVPSKPVDLTGETNPIINNIYNYEVSQLNDIECYNWSATGGVVTGTSNIISVTWNTLGTQILSVKATNNCGISEETNLIVNVKGSQNSIYSLSQNGISIYPNPSIDKIFITNLKEGIIISIYSITGQKLKEIKAQSEVVEINIFNFQSGEYVIKLIDKNMTYFGKIIKVLK